MSGADKPARTVAREGYRLCLPGGGVLHAGGLHRALVMGILNVTPDSFADGGRYYDESEAVSHGEDLAADGADVIDVGGESTRPGSERVAPEEQIRRTAPVIGRLASRVNIPISIDTTSSAVARRALDAGAQIINDISALRDDDEMAGLAAERNAVLILMHMQGRPRTMQEQPHYDDVVGEVGAFLEERIEAAVDAGVSREKIIVDPGFGFDKNFEHNMTLLRDLRKFEALHRPVLVGTSRKSMIGRIVDAPPDERDFGTAATFAAAVERGAAMVRAHNVRAAAEVVMMMAAIQGRLSA